MSFRLGPGPRKYYADIEKHSKTGKFRSMWDFYYLCFMVGGLRQEIGEEPTPKHEFLKEFTQDFRPHREEILATLIDAELRRQGAPATSETEIRATMSMLLDGGPSTRLSAHGTSLMNQYAQGGFEIIADAIDQPRDLAQFLIQYHAQFCK